MRMMGVEVKSMDLTGREKGIPFSDVWGIEPPRNFEEVHEISRMLVNRMAWIECEVERLEDLVRQHINSLNTDVHGMGSRMAANHIVEAEGALERMRVMREQAECDIVTMFPPRNPYRTRDMVMQEVNRVLDQHKRNGA